MDQNLAPQYQPQIYSPLPPGADDALLVKLWLDQENRPATTVESYMVDIRAFLQFVKKPLREVNLVDMKNFSTSLHENGYADATIARRLRAVKSLFSYAATTQYLPFNIGASVRVPKPRRNLHERILSKEEVLRMFICEENIRNRQILRLLYYTAARVSELCGLCWKDINPGTDQRGNPNGIVAIFGKGSKERYVAIKQEVYEEFLSFRGDAPADAPVFVSRGGGRAGKKAGGHLDKNQVEMIVGAAAQKAGIARHITPHMLRHSHGTHAVEAGAPIAVVRRVFGHESIETTMLYVELAGKQESTADYL